ncbi:peptide-methionine (R)-S-oxide reductase, partial [Stenotrophomonas maltophilia]|uniref:peptide-methionine (R)-S-oxide reductase n=1 Tax=Stenotrophomonas maltophilia TaxID=40324 RepID=UPI003CCFF1CE
IGAMTTRRLFLAGGTLGLAAAAGSPWRVAASGSTGTFAVALGDAEWRRRLTPAQYAVLRQSGTERPYSSALLHEERRGRFACAGCGLDLF